MDLAALLETVCDEATFLAFVRALEAERSAQSPPTPPTPPAPESPQTPRTGNWEDAAIATFLDAALRWADHPKFGKSPGIGPANAWRALAKFLYTGTLHE